MKQKSKKRAKILSFLSGLLGAGIPLAATALYLNRSKRPTLIDGDIPLQRSLKPRPKKGG
jgi:hypothetical protein